MSNYIKVNGNTFEYLYFDDIDCFYCLNTTDINLVKNSFKTIDTIETYDDDSLIGVYTEWGTYSRIWIKDNEDSFYVCVSLRKADYESQIRKLDDQINPKYDVDLMTNKELREYIKKKTSEKCRETIYSGMEIETSYGKELFTFNAEDQQNLKELCDIALSTQVDIPYHRNGDNNNCVIYPWQDIVKIYATLSSNKIYHTTYQNAVNNYIQNIYDMEILKNFKYGDELPESYTENIDKMLEQGQKAIDAMLLKAGLIS